MRKTIAGGDSPLSATDLAVDHLLAQLAVSYRFLLDLTPANSADERMSFLAGDRDVPDYRYRELDADPAVLRAQLEMVNVDAVGDDILRELMTAKRRELELQADMLDARGTASFRALSVEAYGEPDDELLAQAEQILDEVPAKSARGERVNAEEFLALAEEEISRYAEVYPEADMHAEIRGDVAGVVVEGDTLLIAPTSSVERNRVMALIHHEVGTHLVTRVNGGEQTLHLLGTGFAGYDETQEGLAVLAEVIAGQLTNGRLRQLAARVIAVNSMLAGASFPETHKELTKRGVPRGNAYTTTMRVHRSGGLTKDAVYLRGLRDVLRHVRDGGSLEHLWVGKFALADLDRIQHLADIGALAEAKLTPRYLELPHAAERLRTAAASVSHLPSLVNFGDTPVSRTARATIDPQALDPREAEPPTPEQPPRDIPNPSPEGAKR